MKEYLRITREVILTPLSYIYGAITYVRNKLFDLKILKSEEFDIPVVSIGNLAVGGTGKTPHTEYIVDLLCGHYNIAVLSRGYKRKTKGFILASENSTPLDIGDESYQIYQKFGDRIKVAVCEKRVVGIKELQKIDPNINLIILDDAFQHRYVKPRVSIVLTEYNRPYYEDRLMPLGRLRENIRAVNRAEMVIITKCPDDIKPMDFRIKKKNTDLFPYQKLFFSRYRYDSLTPVFPAESTYVPMLEIMNNKDVVLTVTGIANPRPLVKYLKTFNVKTKVMHFPDHHNFSRDDIMDIQNTFNSLKGRYKIIITTEKDAVRLSSNPYFPHSLKQHIFYQPINVEFLEYEDDFDSTLIQLITKK